MKIAIIGFNDLGHYIKDMIMEFFSVIENDIIYFDDNLYKLGAEKAFPFEHYIDGKFENYSFYVCLGYKHLSLKKEILEKLLEMGRKVPNFIHPTAYVHPSVQIGPGSFIYPSCSIDRNTIIGKGVWIANSDTIAHDCFIGDCCWFGATVTLSGKVSVKGETFIGSGTTISNDITIGERVIVGLGTVVTKNIDNGLSVIGSPMKILDRKIKLI